MTLTSSPTGSPKATASPAAGYQRPLLAWRDAAGAFSPRRGAAALATPAGGRLMQVPSYLQHLMSDFLPLSANAASDKEGVVARLMAEPTTEAGALPSLPDGGDAALAMLPSVPGWAARSLHATGLAELPPLPAWAVLTAVLAPPLPTPAVPVEATPVRQPVAPQTRPKVGTMAVAKGAQAKAAAHTEAPRVVSNAQLILQAEALARRALSLYDEAGLARVLRQATTIEEYHYLKALRASAG